MADELKPEMTDAQKVLLEASAEIPPTPAKVRLEILQAAEQDIVAQVFEHRERYRVALEVKNLAGARSVEQAVSALLANLRAVRTIIMQLAPKPKGGPECHPST